MLRRGCSSEVDKENYYLTAEIQGTAYLFSEGGLRRPIVDPARHATFLR